MEPTKETYGELDRAYDHFNEALFDGTLPACLLTMQRKKRAYGYFWGDTWTDVSNGTVTDEIALNPDHFQKRPVAESLSTLVHEMCHLQQHHFGKPSRGGYHNREWAAMMEEVGLIPSDTGQEGGKKSGQRVSHYIETQGRFDMVCAKLLEGGFTIPWQPTVQSDKENETRRKKAASKTKYTCPSCGLNAWGKPDIRVVCMECEVELEA